MFRPDLSSSIRCIIPYYYGSEYSSLYTCNTSWRSVHYMILNKPLVRLTTAHYQSTVSMISFAQVLTAQWSDTIPDWNIWFQVRITSHDIPFQHIPPPENPHSTSCLDMSCKPSLISLKLPTFQLWKNNSETLIPHRKKHLPHTNLCSNSWEIGSSPNLPLSKSTTRSGLKPETSNGTSLTRNSHPNEKDPSPSHWSYHPYPMNSNSPPHGQSTLYSTCHFSPPIMKIKLMDWTSQLHPQILLIMKKNMKLNGY